MLASISSVELIELPHHKEENGDLVVMEGEAVVPFSIVRVFVVRAPEGAIRGQHAHRKCRQFLTCSKGVVEVKCDDGLRTARFVLDRAELGLLVPAGIWSEQTYTVDDSVLTVLCDRHYESNDYIRNYREFRTYRNG